MAEYRTPGELLAEIEALKVQIKGLVESQRNDLRGDWDAARIWLDAVDPGGAGGWTNVPFPKE